LSMLVLSQQTGIHRYRQRLELMNLRRIARDQATPSDWHDDNRWHNQGLPEYNKEGHPKLRQIFIRPQKLEALRAAYRKKWKEAQSKQAPWQPSISADTSAPLAGTTNSNQLTTNECQEMWRTAQGFGISDIVGYAQQNCAILQIYFPESTCEQLSQAVISCAEQ